MLYNKNWNRNRVARLLLEAADLIEHHGHTKNQLYGPDGSMCLMGALEKARAVKDVDSYAAMQGAARAVADTLKLGWYCPIVDAVEWNNAPERTGAEVVDAMRQAAATVEAGAG